MSNERLEKMADFFDGVSEIYEERHLGKLEGGEESKRSIAVALPAHTKTLLDLGIGTGLELEEIYRRFPAVEITGLDIAAKMLAKLREKYPDKRLNLVQQSYLAYDFGQGKYDAIISSMTMHHYTHAVKVAIYSNIRKALKDGGRYVENDYILSEIDMPNAAAEESRLFAEYEQIKKEQGLQADCDYHFDTPCTLQNQIAILQQAGFKEVRLVWQRRHNITLAAFT